MADKVMRMPDKDIVQAKFFKPAVSSLQRKCEHCEEEEKKKVQRKKGNANVPAISTTTENYINTLSGGKQLNQSEKSFFEPRFGYDFSSVRIHTGTAAAKSASSINALAYTSGNNIVFNYGQFSTNTDNGKKLLAHELTHVMQQQGEGKTIQRYTETTDPNTRFGQGAADVATFVVPVFGIGRTIYAIRCLKNLEAPMIDITFNRWIAHVCGRTTGGTLHNREWDAFGHCWIGCEGSRACGNTPTNIAGTGREYYREFQRLTGSRPHDSFTQDLANQRLGRDLSYTAGTCYALCDNAHSTRALNLTAPQATCINCSDIAAGEYACPP